MASVALALSVISSSFAISPGPRNDVERYARRRVYGERPGPRMLIISFVGGTWSDFRSAAMPNLNRIIEQGDAGLMPVGSLSDADSYRTLVTLGAGREAAAGQAGSLGYGVRRHGPDGRVAGLSASGGLQVDIAPIVALNRRARTGATPGFLGTQLHDHGLTTAVVAAQALPQGEEALLPEAAMVMDDTGRVDGWRVATVMPNETTLNLDRAAIRRAINSALAQYDVVVLAGAGGKLPSATLRAGLPNVSAGRLDSPTELERYVERREWCRGADGIVADAVAAIAKYNGLLAVLGPVAPAYRAPFRNRSLGPVVLYDSSGKEPGGLLYSARTRWPGIVTAADFAPTVLSWWDIPAEGLADRLRDVQGTPERLDHLDRTLTDRYRLRVPAAKWYVCYGGLVALLGALAGIGVPALQHRGAGGLGLGLALVPVGLAVAAPVPPGHDAWYLLLTGLVAVGVGASVARAARSAAQGLALVMLLGAAVIVADVLNGSPLMRFSALEMGVMMGSRFYGIGNEYMGALVGMTVIGLGAMTQLAPSRGRFAALIGAFVVLVIGAPFWGANWGGSFTAACGMMALWLANLRRVKTRHTALAAVALIMSIVLPAALDLLNPPASRSHIGAAAAALMGGNATSLTDTVARKAGIALKVIGIAPWSVLAALIAAAALWVQLRRGAPARRALAGQRALGAGIAAALVAGVVAMLVNDSGPAAGFGAILAALGAVVFLATRAPEPAA